MLLSCYIMLFISESSTSFFVSHNYVTCDCDIYDHPVTDITSHSLSKSKINKNKNKAGRSQNFLNEVYDY